MTNHLVHGSLPTNRFILASPVMGEELDAILAQLDCKKFLTGLNSEPTQQDSTSQSHPLQQISTNQPLPSTSTRFAAPVTDSEL